MQWMLIANVQNSFFNWKVFLLNKMSLAIKLSTYPKIFWVWITFKTTPKPFYILIQHQGVYINVENNLYVYLILSNFSFCTFFAGFHLDLSLHMWGWSCLWGRIRLLYDILCELNDVLPTLMILVEK